MWINLLLVAFYISGRYLVSFPYSQALDGYIGYAFDLCFIAIMYFFKPSPLKIFGRFDQLTYIWMATNLMGGLVVYLIADRSGIGIPYNLLSWGNIVLLVLVGPILEEFLFRFGVWSLIERFTKKAILLVLISAIWFSAEHFQAYFRVPEQIHAFVWFQTFYTFLIAVQWGAYYSKRRALIFPISMHICFNTGFWFGTFIPG